VAEDTRNFIEQTLDRAEIHDGKELSPDEMAKEFAKLGPNERLEHLDRMKMESSGEISIEKAARQLSYARAIKNMDQRLRKVGR
jgi:hypothetical protein